MALFGGKNEDKPTRFEETSREVGREVQIAAEGRSSSEPADVQAHLGRGSRVEGTLTFQGSVRIDGQVEGQIEAKDTVVIGEAAAVVAQITAATVVIKGNVTGDVTASKRVELRSPGRLLGNIVTPSLVIQDGVVFEGHCSMAGADVRASERDKKVAIFPKDDRLPSGGNRVEAVK
jgi:cytoskeletal protein CcmA (bactofilin family)